LANAAFSAAEPAPAAVLVVALAVALAVGLVLVLDVVLAALVPGVVALLEVPLLLDEQAASRATAVNAPSAAAAYRVPREICIRRL
jgi:hypothetical protein